MRLIATEEAWSIPEVGAELKKVAHGPSQSLDKPLVKGVYDVEPGQPGYDAYPFLDGLLDAIEPRYHLAARQRVAHRLGLDALGIAADERNPQHYAEYHQHAADWYYDFRTHVIYSVLRCSR